MKPILRLILAVVLSVFVVPTIAAAQARYTVKTNGDVVQLRDTRADMVVSILTPVNNAYEFVVKGENVIRMTIQSVDQMRANPGTNGIPLLAPFANRLDEQAFYANGKKYNFDMELGNVRGAVPIHGFLSGTNAWKVVEAKADGTGAWITSKLDFWKYPSYMKQFPFAHTLTMTYKLADGALEVRTRLDNLSTEPMPVSLGFHPYFQLTDSVRTEWTLDAGARTHWLLAPNKVPTGETEPSDQFWGGDRHAVPLSKFATTTIDDVFSDLDRDAQGRGTFSITGAKQKLEIIVGPKFKSMTVFSPAAGGGGGGAGRGAGAPGAGGPAPVGPGAAAAPGGRAAAAGAPPQGAAGPPGAPGPAGPAGGAGAARGGGGGRVAGPPVSVGPPIPLSAKDSGPAPPLRGSVAIEPMAGISNSMNAAQKGTYKELQYIDPSSFWQESFWVRPTGY